MLYEKYSTVFAFDPPMQDSLYIYIYIRTVVWKYFVVKKIFVGNETHENSLHEKFLT